jgi:hypothetical protein
MIRLEQLKQELEEKGQVFQQERVYRGIGELTLCPLFTQAGAAEAGAGGKATGLRAGAPRLGEDEQRHHG